MAARMAIQRSAQAATRASRPFRSAESCTAIDASRRRKASLPTTSRSALAAEPVAQRTRAAARPNLPERLQSGLAQLEAMLPGSGRASARTEGLPSRLQAGLQGLSGLDLSGVRVHYDAQQPARLGAHAYARGQDIYLAPGQVEHLPHEGWHVVQQLQGRVRATVRTRQSGDAINDDPRLESEAERMGSLASRGSGPDRMGAISSAQSAFEPVVQRVIHHSLAVGKLSDYLDPAKEYFLPQLIGWIKDVRAQRRGYNQAEGRDPLQASMHLHRLVLLLDDVTQSVGFALAAFSQDNASKPLYVSLNRLQEQVDAMAEEVNDAMAQALGIVRAGPGNRPDANAEAAVNASITVANQGLAGAESTFYNHFLAVEGDQWKLRREALSGAAAIRAGHFADLHAGKTGADGAGAGNEYGIDVEYRTADAGMPTFWDQKTIYFDEAGWDARLAKTHDKLHKHLRALPDKDRPVDHESAQYDVGILLDSTFVRRRNYEKAWLTVHRHILEGSLRASSVKEVHAPNLQALRAGIYVDMTQVYAGDSVEQNVKWAEAKLQGARAGLPVMPVNQLGATNYAAVVGPAAVSWSRHLNTRGWLPSGTYDEHAVGAGLPNNGKGRFVISTDGRVYLTVTHYKGYTVRLANGQVHNRNPFYRVL